MPIMSRMRDSMPVVLFGLLIIFLITIVFEWGMDYLGLRQKGGDVLGKVNGKTVHYKEFSELLKNYTDNQKSQTGAEPDDEQLKQARDQVWQTLVTQHLLNEEIDKFGLSVTDQELVDWVRGDNPPEDLRKNFVDSTGQFRKDMYDQFLSNPNQFVRDPRGVDAEYGTRWLSDYEKNLRQRRLQEKLQSLVTASIRVTEGEVRQRFLDQSQKFDALYALFDANVLIRDSAAQVGDAELKSYYEENLDQYHVDATRKLKYVVLKESASAADTASRHKEMDDAVAKAKSGMDFIQLVYTYSDKADSGAFFRHGELNVALENPVFSARPGSIVGPIEASDGLHLVKVLGERPSDKEYMHASHILFSLNGEPDTNAVKMLAQRVAKEARDGKDFAELARKYSKDGVSSQRGGDLGWFSRGRMAAAFENAAFKARAGDIVGPVRSPFGLHIIKVIARDNRELKLANITMQIGASPQTKNDAFDRAKDFAFNAKESDFVKEAQQTGLDVRETQVQEKSVVIPGIGVDESVTKWAFSSKVGSVGEPVTIPSGQAVFTIVEAKDAGVRSFDDLKETIRPLALRKKKAEMAKALAADLRAKLVPGDSLARLRDWNPAVIVQQTGPFAASGMIPMIGRDMNFLGAVSALQVGQISPAVQSQRGAYVVQLISRTAFDTSAFNAQREMLQSRLLQEKKSRLLNEWVAQLKEKAEIEDHRENFYR